MSADETCACGSLWLSATVSERHDRGLHGADRCVGMEWPTTIKPALTIPTGAGRWMTDADLRDHDAALTAKAKAEALREAADDVHEVSGHSAGVPVWRADIADWLRERADREES